MDKMIRRGDCKNCPNEKIYFIMTRSTAIDVSLKDKIKKWDGRVKNHPQCKASILPLPNKRILGEICRPQKLKLTDINISYTDMKFFNEDSINRFKEKNPKVFGE